MVFLSSSKLVLDDGIAVAIGAELSVVVAVALVVTSAVALV